MTVCVCPFLRNFYNGKCYCSVLRTLQNDPNTPNYTNLVLLLIHSVTGIFYVVISIIKLHGMDVFYKVKQLRPVFTGGVVTRLLHCAGVRL